RGVNVRCPLVVLRRFLRLPLRELHFAEVVEHLARGGRAGRRLLQRLLCGRDVALLEVRHADADLRLVVVRIGLEEVVVGGDCVVVFLLVAVGGGDLQVDDAERRRLGQDGAVGGNRLVPLLRVEELIRAGELGLQVLGGEAAERTRSRVAAALPQREGERRVGGANRLDVYPGPLRGAARRPRRARPAARP